MIYLTLDELLYVAGRTLPAVQVRDAGLLAAAVARPATTVLGEEAYPTLATKAAALLHSLARTQGLIDGNKRLALAGTIAFLGLNGERLTLTNDEAYDLVMAVAEGALDDVAAIAAQLRTRPATASR